MSTRPRSKATKPYPDFPRFAHADGQWSKKVRGPFVYFGPWDLAEKVALHAGFKTRREAGTVTGKDACNTFLNAKDAWPAAQAG